MSVRGVLQVHSAPPALCPHIEWAVAGGVGMALDLGWGGQPAAPGMGRAELDLQATPGTAAALTPRLGGRDRQRVQVTQEARPRRGAMGHNYTPSLGLFSAVTMANGDVLIPEGRLRAAMTVAAGAAAGVVCRPRLGAPGAPADRVSSLEDELARLLGQPWDDELEPFRCAGDGAPVRWLHATG